WKPSQKFKGKTFALAGKLSIGRDRAEELVKMEGGKLVDDVTGKLDYLVTGPTRTGSPSSAEKKANQLNQNKGAAIQIISDTDFLALFAPSREEVIAMLKGGEEGMSQWSLLAGVPMPDLSGADLQGLELSGDSLRGELALKDLKLDSSNLSNSRLSEQWL